MRSTDIQPGRPALPVVGARVASGHVAAVPPKSVMNSRRRIDAPCRNHLTDVRSLALCGGAASENGQTIGSGRCGPMAGWGQNRKSSMRAYVFSFALVNGHEGREA